MFDYEKLAALAKECGFTHTATVDVSKLEFSQGNKKRALAKCGENLKKNTMFLQWEVVLAARARLLLLLDFC